MTKPTKGERGIDHWIQLNPKYGYSIKEYAELVDELGLEEASDIVNLNKSKFGEIMQSSYENAVFYIENIFTNEFDLVYEKEFDRDTYSKYFILMAYAHTKRLAKQAGLIHYANGTIDEDGDIVYRSSEEAPF